jgi:hypothetical protein
MKKEIDIQWLSIVMLLLLAIIGLAWYALVTGKNIQVIEVVLTALILKLGTMIDYKYGSSAGSKEKTELMSAERRTESAEAGNK